MRFKGLCRIRWERGGKNLPVFFCRREKVNVSAQIYVATVRLNINQTARDSSCTVPNSNSIICLLLTQYFSQRQIILWKVLAAGNRKTFIDLDFVVGWVFCDVVGFFFLAFFFEVCQSFTFDLTGKTSCSIGWGEPSLQWALHSTGRQPGCGRNRPAVLPVCLLIPILESAPACWAGPEKFLANHFLGEQKT